ncbi:hypothetical protein [Natronoglycomyces albus]|uniref:Uncharacterized protein n=1 Tax=Natronoglycomyces albus TaxID=2811108 RepID=A0A895XNG1_9ACTN|nr:hypothetical protein [Natronoglycomyces albus]QSB04026.1 hypothetical protein JQS30_09335 [Natronoglycomyces albus]
MVWLVTMCGLVVALATYVWWSLRRVNRLHQRVHGAERALVAKLDERAATVLKWADRPECDEAVRIAKEVVCAPVNTTMDRERRQYRENDLTEILRALPPSLPAHMLEELAASNRRVSVARQVHTDVVRDAITSRERRVAVWLRFAERLPRPEYWELADPKLRHINLSSPVRA